MYTTERSYPANTDKNSMSLFRGTPIAHPTVIIRTEVLKKYQYNINTSSNEDIDLWFRLILDGYSIKNINEPLLKFRITDRTFLRRNYKKSFNEFKIYCYYLIRLHRFSVSLIFPLLRFILRLFPAYLIRKIYFSKNRQKLLTGK